MRRRLEELSPHFVERWEERVGGVPGIEMVRTIMNDSAPIIDCIEFRDRCGTWRCQPAIYWHPDLQLVLKIDHTNGRAISVMSRDEWLKRVRRRPCRN
jgi:hypothetical protein